MIKIKTAYTQELDGHRKAINDILSQIDIKNGLLKNSVALIFCHAKFIETGIMEAVACSLPFDALGCTSHYFAVRQAFGEFMLTVTVLTSDDVEFSVGVSGPLAEENVQAAVESLYRETASLPGAEPSLVFAFPPTIMDLTGDVMLSALDRACAGIPIFGTEALDVAVHVRNPMTIFRGAAYRDRMAVLLFRGAVKPRFQCFAFPAKSVISQDAVITGAEGNRILSINNGPADSFMKEMGLFQDNQHAITPAIPLVIEGGGNPEPKVLIVHAIGSNGELICGSQVRAGCTVNIGSITSDYVFESLNALIQEIKKNGEGDGLFVCSCFSRSIVLGGNPLAEMEMFQKELESMSCPYLFLSSGGEPCPHYTEEGGLVNHMHQYALTACQF